MFYAGISDAFVIGCLCVCERERERERESVGMCVCVSVLVRLEGGQWVASSQPINVSVPTFVL